MEYKTLNNIKYIFSGHESFQCRNLWLKKGFDFVKKNKSFNDEDAVVELGVGKNMVSSIRFWMKAFNILTADDKLTQFAFDLLDDDGYDPFLEDDASLWLLHFYLVKIGFASSYSFIFNELRKEKIEFTKDNFIALVKRKSETEQTFPYNEKTLAEDFSVLIKMYLRNESQNNDKEDGFSGILTDLDLIKSFSKNKETYYFIENSERNEIPVEIILYMILESDNFDLSISLNSIEHEYNSIGSIFAINRTGILKKIEDLAAKYPFIIFNDQAGIKELQFKSKPSSESILKKYYEN